MNPNDSRQAYNVWRQCDTGVTTIYFIVTPVLLTPIDKYLHGN